MSIIYSTNGEVLCKCSCDTEGIITIPHGIIAIRQAAFKDCKLITNITLPATLKRIGNNAFCGCDSLKSIQFSNDVEYIGEAAFKNCRCIESVTIPTSLTELPDGIFEGCHCLMNVKMPKDSIKRIGDNCFKRCFSMESIVIPQTVVSVGKAFVDCRSLRIVTIMNSNTIIDKKAFDGCDELSVKCIVPVSKFLSICNCNYHRKPKPISLKRHFRNSKVLAPYFLKIYRTPERVEVIEEMTFLGWTGLECIGISSSVKSIEKRAFAGCINLTQLNFEEGIEAIGRYAFEDCSGLRTLHLPNSLKVIKDFAFAGCSKLVHVSISEYTEVADTAFEKNIKISYRH
jgi:hypothetical protein